MTKKKKGKEWMKRKEKEKPKHVRSKNRLKKKKKTHKRQTMIEEKITLL